MTNNKKLILACIDGSKLSEAVCDYAVWLAQRVEGPLKLMYTIDHHPETAKEIDLSGCSFLLRNLNPSFSVTRSDLSFGSNTPA